MSRRKPLIKPAPETVVVPDSTRIEQDELRPGQKRVKIARVPKPARQMKFSFIRTILGLDRKDG
jgi:hypothetical protein